MTTPRVLQMTVETVLLHFRWQRTGLAEHVLQGYQRTSVETTLNPRSLPTDIVIKRMRDDS
jgi:hypothetical protein